MNDIDIINNNNEESKKVSNSMSNMSQISIIGQQLNSLSKEINM
jgi:hypothetical protein